MIWAEAPLLGFGNSGLWLQQHEGEATALVLRNTVGGVTLAALPGADFSELAEFLQVVGFDSLTLPQNCCEKLVLPNTQAEEYLLMQWREQEAALPFGLFVKPIDAQMLLQNTLAAFEQQLGEEEQQEWKWAFELRRRRGTALALGLFVRQEMAAAAALSHIGRNAAIIGFVGTNPNHKGNGYGCRIAAAAAARAAEKGLVPLLCCRAELEKIYRTAGFAALGKQAVLKHRI
jgi:RimJ/RimL family protein N-acetyltransferase